MNVEPRVSICIWYFKILELIIINKNFVASLISELQITETLGMARCKGIEIFRGSWIEFKITGLLKYWIFM